MTSTNRVYTKMKQMIEGGKTYRFKSLDDEDPFEPFEGVPVDVGSEMFVRVTKGNGKLKEGTIVGIDPDEFCFMDISEVEG